MATIHRIGGPENPSEARAIRELAGALPLDLDLLRRELGTPGCEDFMAHPQDAIDTIQKMCAFAPAARYATMDGVIEDLELIGD
ncbi:MAG: hypothetical protein HY906_08260 [Deltaproteobacteria bacterium]|nr:hypothetical protein [Deltaproteobacteria bacterium]